MASRAGAKGKRYALPHSRIMIHQPLGGVQGQATDIDIQAREILRTREQMTTSSSSIPGKACGRSNATPIGHVHDRKAGVEYGIVDEVIVSRPNKKP